MNIRVTRALGALAAFAAFGSAQAVVIDTFDSGAYDISANSINPSSEAVRAGTMLGGERDVLLTYTTGPLSVFSQVIIADGGANFFNSQSQTDGFVTLQYDGRDGESEGDDVLTDGSSLGGDFTGSQRFELDFRFLNTGIDGSLAITTTVQTSTGVHTFVSNVAEGFVGTHSIAFSNFAGADFSDVRRVQFTFNGPAATDFTLTEIRTAGVIPGPAAMLPFLAGLYGASRRRTRR